MSKISAGPPPALQQHVAAEHRQPRLLLRRNDVEYDAGLLAHTLDEFGAVGGPAARFGRDRARQVDVAAAKLVGADLQGVERPRHRRVAQPARTGKPFAQPARPG